MLFSSVIFIFLFLPIVLAGYYLIRREYRNYFLLFFSLFFYAWGEPKYVIIMFASILLNYWMALIIQKYKKTYFLMIAISLNLVILAFFKYLHFVFMIVDSIFPIPNLVSSSEKIVLPIGISFFTFQAMSYCIDVHYKRVEVQSDLSKVALYISFFPQLIAGPIVRYIDIAREIDTRSESFDDFVLGARRFIIGLSKKVLIANVLAQSADRAFNTTPSELNLGFSAIGVLFYTFQIYFDFSGYSDMAIGLGRMFGFHFFENFKNPYSASSLRDFWRRWHISLSSWFRDYLYLPLGGNREGNFRTGLNLVIVFLLCGLWHGASWTFVIWGVWHGMFLVLERTSLGKIIDKLPGFAKSLYTMFVVCTGWIFFRSDSLTHAMGFFNSFLVLDTSNSRDHILNYLNNEIYVILIFAFMLSSERITSNIKSLFKRILNEEFKAVIINFCLLLLFFISIAKLALGTYNPFIYFRF